MSMRAFVSAQIDEKPTARRVFDLLREMGIEVTHDWTLTDDLHNKKADTDEAGRRAASDITGVVQADLYILLTDNERPGKGMYVELGAALALNEVGSRPQVFIVGPLNHLSIFYYHPAVRHCADLEDLRRTMSSLCHATNDPSLSNCSGQER